MTFRAAVAAGLMAAVSLACSEAPRSQPTTKQARVVTPPKKLGTYTMTVTPLAQYGGRKARVEVVPDVQDGNPSTNPGGTVQVAGRFFATIEPAGGNGCAGQSLALPLTVTNFAAEPLDNVQVQITSMSKTGFEVCKVNGATSPGNPALLPPPADTAPGAALGLANYGALGGATSFGLPVNDGSGPGGTRALTFWFKFPSNTPVTFKFSVWADPRQPELVPPGPELDVGLPLTWTSAGSATTRLEFCAVDPLLTSGRCPAASLTATAPVTGTGAGPWSFTAVPATVSGTTYFWRAVNTFAGVPGNYGSDWDTFVATTPLTAGPPTLVAPLAGVFPADSLVAALPILLQWDTAANITDAVYQICTGPCPAPFTPGDPNALNLVWEDVATYVLPAPPVSPTGYEVDVSGFLPLDPATGNNWLLPASYTWTVWNWDAANAVTVGSPASSTFTVAPAVAAAPEFVSPLAGDTFPANSLALSQPILVQWISDPAVTSTVLQVCDTPDCLPNVALGLQGVLPIFPITVNGVAALPGAPTEYALDILLDLPTDPNAGDAWLLPGFYYVQVDNLVGGLAQGVPVTTSFEVTSSMPPAAALTSPANGASFLQNALNVGNNPAGFPIPFAWFTAPEVLNSYVEVCTTPTCDDGLGGSTVINGPLFFAGTPAGAVTTFAADGAIDGILFNDLGVTGGSGGAYLMTGTFYWRVYNEDPVSFVALAPPSGTRSVVIAPFAPAFAAAAGNPATASFAAPPVTIGWTGHATLMASTIEVCGATLGCSYGVAANTTVGGPSATFSIDLVGSGVIFGADLYTMRVMDDDVALTLGTVAPAAFWTGIGTINVTP